MIENHGDVKELLKRANEFIKDKDYINAEEECKRAIKLYPNSAEAHWYLGNILYIRRKYKEAEKEYRDAIKLNPNFAPAYRNLRLLLHERSRDKEAKCEAEEMIPEYGEMKLINFLLSQHGIIFNLAFGIYFLFFKDWLLEALRITMNYEQKNYIIAIIFAIVSILEVLGYFLKLPLMKKRLAPDIFKIGVIDGDKKSVEETLSRFTFLVWICHSVVGIIIGFWIIQGINPEAIISSGDAEDFSLKDFFLLVYIIIILIKELILLFLLMGRVLVESVELTEKDEILFFLDTKIEWLADFFIFTFSIIAFTTTWEFMVYQGTTISSSNFILTLINVICATILFFIFYLPSRMIYLIEELLLIKVKKSKTDELFIYLFSFILPLLIAIGETL